MKIWKIIWKIVFGLLLIVCLLSLVYFLWFTNLLDIQKVSLKEGRFDMINKENEFEFGNLRNKLFNIVLRFYKEEGTDYSGLYSGEVPYAIDIELRDEGNKSIRKEVKKSSFMPAGSYGDKYFQWTLVQFDAEKGKKYKVKIVFSSDNKNYDAMKKEIFVQQDYDYASMPYWYLFQRVFLVVFIATLVPVLITGFIMWRKKKNRTG